MEQSKSKIRSVFGLFAVVGLVGWLVLVIAGDWERSFFYLDLAMLSITIALIAPTIVSRIDNSVVDNHVLLFVTRIVWTFTLIIPFVLITMKQGRFVMMGIVWGGIFLLIFLLRKTGDQLSGNKGKWVYFIILLFPYVYALAIWFDLQLTGLFLLLSALNLLVYTEISITNTIRNYKAKEHWLPLKIKYPEEEPLVSFDQIIGMKYPEHLELGFVKARMCQLEATIHYEVNDIPYEKNAFLYNWVAPFDDRLKEFSYPEALKGKELNLIYDPQNPIDITIWFGAEEAVKEKLSSYNRRQKKYRILALGISVLGFFLFFFKIAVT